MDGDKEDKDENEMRQSILVQLYLNMSVAYMRSGAFSLARRVLEDANALKPVSAVIAFRKAQCVCYNLKSSVQQLEEAGGLVIQALSMRHHEKVFSASPVVLDMLGYKDSQQTFTQLAVRIEQRKVERLALEQKIRDTVLADVDLMGGKTSRGFLEMPWEEQDVWEEYHVMQLLVQKYYDMIQLFMDSDKLDAVE